jgi:AbrB family looped-hinge helix DNA binding protein
VNNTLGDSRDREYNYYHSMEELYTTKIVKVGTSKAVVIPTNVLDGLGWKRGDRVVFTFAGEDQLIVKKLDDETIRRIKEVGHMGDEPTIHI